jgi:hypothetical protein
MRSSTFLLAERSSEGVDFTPDALAVWRWVLHADGLIFSA